MGHAVHGPYPSTIPFAAGAVLVHQAEPMGAKAAFPASVNVLCGKPPLEGHQRSLGGMGTSLKVLPSTALAKVEGLTR